MSAVGVFSFARVRTVRLLETGDRFEMVDIDTEEDFAFAEALWIGSRPGAAPRPSMDSGRPEPVEGRERPSRGSGQSPD